MTRRLVASGLLLVAGCSARLGERPVTDGFAQEALREAGKRGPRPATDAARLHALIEGFPPSGGVQAPGGGGAFDAEGLVLLDAAAQARVDALSDPRRAEELLGGHELDQEGLLLAAYARNPGVLSARASWRATVRMLDQATYLEEILARYRALAETAAPTGIDRSMSAPAFPYPGLVALRGEMLALEVRMAREAVRMRLRDTMADVVMAYVETLARSDEEPIREDQLALTERLLASARARATAGTSPNAEVLEAEAELAMARSQRSQTTEESASARARLNTLLGRAPTAPMLLSKAPAPSTPAPALETLLRLAGRFSPELRMASYQAQRTAVAIRMGEAMLLSPAGPRSPPSIRGLPTDAPTRSPGGAGAAGAGDGMARMGAGDRPTGAAAAGADAAPMGADGMGEAATEPPRATFAQDLAWLAELRERRSALERSAEEARSSVERSVIEAQLAYSTAQRMLSVAETTSAPLARQAVAERMRAYETGRAEFSELVAALGRVLASGRQVVEGRRMLREAEARLWMAVGARWEVVASGDPGAPR